MEAGHRDALLNKGIEALRRGDLAAARRAFEGLAAAPWMLLAQACRECGDLAGLEDALARQLVAKPRDLSALLAMGEIKARQGDERGAASFFQAAIAQSSGKALPPALGQQLERARMFLGSAAGRFERHLLGSLDDAGLLGTRDRRRVRHAIDLLVGKVPVYQQQPTMFYFPELPQRTFYEREEFCWLKPMEAATDLMVDELRAVMGDGREFAPYIEGGVDRPSPETSLRDNPDWGAFHFWKDGVLVADNAARCPSTMAALSHAPMPLIPGRSPMALWSLLKPGTHIPPHHGMLNTHLICHIPLIVPDDCGLRVGPEVRRWEFGKTLIFDDSIEHEAWNRSDQIRVILLFEVWRPEILAEERAALVQLFAAIDSFGRPGPTA